jgi:hypothetical protein
MAVEETLTSASTTVVSLPCTLHPQEWPPAPLQPRVVLHKFNQVQVRERRLITNRMVREEICTSSARTVASMANILRFNTETIMYNSYAAMSLARLLTRQVLISRVNVWPATPQTKTTLWKDNCLLKMPNKSRRLKTFPGTREVKQTYFHNLREQLNSLVHRSEKSTWGGVTTICTTFHSAE